MLSGASDRLRAWHVTSHRRRGRPRHHGRRHRGGVRPQRLRRRRRRGRPTRRVERGRAAPRALHRPRRAARQAQRGRAGRRCSAGSRFTTDARRTSPTPTSSSRRSSSRSSSRSEIFRELDDDRRARTRSWPPTPPAVGHRDLAPPTPTRGRVIGVHFFNPAPVQNLVEIIRTVVTEPDVLDDVDGAGRAAAARTRSSCGDKAGFIANTLLFGYLNHAVVDVRGTLRHPRGHRRRDALRLRLPDGPAGAARPDRPRHGVRDPRHDVQAGPRPAARADARSSSRWSPPACSAARPAAASTPTRARTARSWSPTHLTPVGRRPSRSCAHDIAQRRRGRHRHHGHRHRRGLRQGRVRRDVRRRAADAKVDGVARPRSSTRSTRRSSAASSRRPTRDAALGRLTGTHVARRPRRRRPRGRGDRRGPRRSRRRCSRTSTRSASPGAILATTTSSLPVIECAAATTRPAGRRRHALLQPGAGHEAGRGRVARSSTADDVAETTARRCAPAVGKLAGLVRRPGRVHRQRAAVPLPQRRGARCSRRTTRRADDIDTAMKTGCALPDGPVRAARRGRQRRVAGDPARALPRVPRARVRAGARCSSTWSPPATSAARPAAASAPTPERVGPSCSGYVAFGGAPAGVSAGAPCPVLTTPRRQQ